MFSKPANAHKVSAILRSRYTLAAMLCSLVIAAVVVFIPITRGANPASGSVSESTPKVNWTGQIKAPTGSSDCGSGNNAGCDNYSFSFQPPSAAYGSYLLEIKLMPQGDWDMQVYGPNGNLLDGSGNSPGQLEIVTLINPPAGNYSVAAAPFAPVVGTDGNSYAASVELKHHVVNPAAQGADTNVSYHNFAAPGSLGNSSGEPSIGVNWKTDRAMMIAGLQTLRISFDDATVPARATWENKSFALTDTASMDPILFTDRQTGRTIVSQLMTPAIANSLLVFTDACSLSAVTDDDGDTWIPDEGCGPPSGADHQSIGGGPFASPLPRELPGAYSHAVYYCAQSGLTAYCSRSDDGGLTFGPGVPAYTTECGGLHGHPMVGSDGTVYLPNRGCGGKQGVVVSEDNGVTWNVRTVPDSIQGANDPGVAIGAQGTVYFGYQNGDGHANVAVSHDKGLTWTTSKDTGTPYGIKNSAFPRVVAGDDDRAAYAYLGTPTEGPFQDANFNGEWHLFVAHTYDAGLTWTTIDATPTDPVQRGCIWMQGGSNPCRNLLDFMGEAVDKEGRVLVGYADGCLNCADASTSHSNKATIARQVNGRRLFAAYDPSGNPSPTPTPTPTASPTPQQPANVLHFHGNPIDDSGSTGFGMVDVVNGGPFLLPATTLGSGAPAHWDVPSPALDGTAAQNLYDPSWNWNLDAPTTLQGDMNIKWWASCSGCGTAAGQTADWNIRLWADGVKVFETKVTNRTPELPNVPQLLEATVTLPRVTASTNFVLHVDPVFINTQVNTHIYYDSQMACPGSTGSAPCDSQVTMPIVGANPNPSPTPTPVGSPTPTPTPTPGGPEDSCVTPGITVVTDATGDELPPGTAQNDIQKISIAEPKLGAGDSQIVFTMKVGDLSGTLPASSQWKIYFTGPDAVVYWVDLATDSNSVVSYNYGTAANNLDTTIGFPDSGKYTTDGTITIGIANVKVGGPIAGQTLTSVNGVAYMLVGVVLNDLDDTSSGSYTLRGSGSCGGGGTPTPTPTPAGSPTPAPTPIPNAPQYLNYYPPAGVAESFGEPSIGANWKSGKVMFFGGFSPYALRVSFNDATSPATVTWDQTALRLAATPRVAGDPILFTDRDTGRTFVSQLVGLTPFNGMDFTDDDGTTYLPSQGSGIGAGLDHQTVGGGPFHAPIPTGATYPHSVYYCSQEGVNSGGTGVANCALSINGGLTFGPSIPVYAASAYNSCFPLHGHIKIGPDGTAYLPNRGCNGGAGMVVSEDNGITWTARSIPNSSVGSSDASIGIATDGTIFLGYQAADGHPGIAVSHDKGLTWINHTDVGAQVGVKSGIFPAVVAGDGGMDTARAAFAFYGSATAGDQDSPSFKGEWYLYISSTFDGGKTWTTVNATPGDPIQRDGICTRGFQGCTVARNLLDFFDATVDKDGRVIVGYEDGCMNGCVQGGANSNTEKGVIARQRGGKRMFAASDPTPTPTPTPTPSPSPSPSPTVSPTPTPTPTPTPAGILPAPVDPGPKVGFQNYEAPPTLVNVTSSSQGPSAKTVEYLGHDAGEPSVGNNWKTGTTIYQSDLQTLFVTFNDNCASGSPATWVNRPAPTSQFVDSDPIGFTDRYTGRTFAGELTLTSPSCKTSFTDDDGQTWIPTQGSGLGASVDHETIGGGPFHAPLARPANVPGLYPDAVYYCSQLPHAACARSDDGGATYGPIVEVDPVADGHCGGLHGHIKVAPDGTVYLPFNYCDGQGATIVSQDNGVTWTIQHVPNTISNPNIQDPAVGVDNNGRAYFVMSSATGDGSRAVVATTDDAGASWQNIFDVGASYGLKNIAYPAAVAADPGRAAVAFYGTTTTGDESANGFKGVWHLYIAETFDGGLHWTTNDATPNAPIQRGCVWMHGGANICRNLLDFFDMTVDREGRVEVGYVNGCAGGNCAQAAATANGNAYTALAVIARQSSGRRLVAAFDPPNAMNAMSAPGMPSVTTRRVGNVVNLAWSLADTGNSAITSYKVMRGTASGAETLLTTVPGTQTRVDDATATDTSKTYYYKVLATNAAGTSCAANEVAAPYVGDTCSGVILQRNDPTHPESLLASQNPTLAIDYIAAGEPPASNNLMFKMKVSNLTSVPANSRWRIVWNSESATGQQWYVGMKSDQNSNVSFEYGNIATAVVGLVLGVPTETKLGAALPGSNYQPDGTITIYVPKSVVGNPQPGDLLGAVNGRTFTGDNSQTVNLERSTLLIDHTFVKAQRDNGAPAATYMIAGNVDCSGFIEQNVNSLVNLVATNPGSATGVSSFSLAIKNTSTQTIFTPLRVEVAQLTSASGKVKVSNADNAQTGVGATWDFSNSVGVDNILSAGETSAARGLKFSNPNNEPFTVTFNVIGNLARAAGPSGSTPSGGGGGGSGGTSAASPTGTATNMLFSATYNPVLNTLKWQVIKQ